MAEVGIAASIVGIVSFALQLSKKLYEFSTTTSTAGEEICFVARNVTNYADALEILADRLNDDDPVHSKRALKVVCRLDDQSCYLFDRIDEMIPEPKVGRDDITFLQKVAWNFKKSRVQYLAGHIESLKSTVTLLVAVLFAGKRIRARRKSNKHRKLTNSDIANAEKERTRVSIAFVEQVEACNKLPELKRQAAADARLSLEPSSEAEDWNDPLERDDQPESGQLVAGIPTLNLQLGPKRNSEDQKQLVLLHSNDVFSYLLHQYTNVQSTTNLADQTPLETDLYDTTAAKVSRVDTELSESRKTKASPEARGRFDHKIDHPRKPNEKRSIERYRKPSKTADKGSTRDRTTKTEEPDWSKSTSLRTKQQRQNRDISDNSEHLQEHKTHNQRERKHARSVGMEHNRAYHSEKWYETIKEDVQSLKNQHYREDPSFFKISDIQQLVGDVRLEWLDIIRGCDRGLDSAATLEQENERFKSHVLKIIDEAPELRVSGSDRPEKAQEKKTAVEELRNLCDDIDNRR